MIVLILEVKPVSETPPPVSSNVPWCCFMHQVITWRVECYLLTLITSELSWSVLFPSAECQCPCPSLILWTIQMVYRPDYAELHSHYTVIHYAALHMLSFMTKYNLLKNIILLLSVRYSSIKWWWQFTLPVRDCSEACGCKMNLDICDKLWTYSRICVHSEPLVEVCVSTSQKLLGVGAIARAQ